MKIFSLLLAGSAYGQVGAGSSMASTGKDRFDRAFGLLEAWIDTELGGWKKHTKLSNRLQWMNDRLVMNLNDGCVLAPEQGELDEIDAEMDDEEPDRGLSGIEDTTPFNQIFRIMKTTKRLTRNYLSACKKYDHYIGKFNKLKNGMVKGYQRTNNLGLDYDTFPPDADY